MKKDPVIPIVIGLVCLVIGGVMHFTGSAPKADPALIAQCRQNITDRGGALDLIAQCDETAFATAMTATDASSAAPAISAANRSGVGGDMIFMFLMGLGLILLAGGLFLRITKSHERARG